MLKSAYFWNILEYLFLLNPIHIETSSNVMISTFSNAFLLKIITKILLQLEKCASVPTRYQSHGEFFAICAILTVRGLACSERCLKVTNLSCIAVFSPSISLSRHRTELTKSLFDLFGKFFHIWAVDSIILQKGREWLLHANIAAYAKNGNLMFLSPWGEFFTSYHVHGEIVFLCFVHDILADCDWKQILQKHFFPVSIFSGWLCAKKGRTQKLEQDEKFLQFRHVWRLHV